MKAKLRNYILVDIKRAVFTWKWPGSALVVFLMLACNNDTLSTDAATRIVQIPMNGMFVMVALMATTIPYAASFCEDMEYKYDVQLVLRGSGFSYAVSKIMVTFLSGALTMLLGFELYVVFLLMRYGLPDETEIGELRMLKPAYYECLEQGRYGLYFLCTGIQLACLAGALAVVGLMCSLFIRNRMLAYVLPIASIYVVDIVLLRFLGLDMGSTLSLYCMGITALGQQLEGQYRYLFYLESFVTVLCASMVICLKRKRR